MIIAYHSKLFALKWLFAIQCPSANLPKLSQHTSASSRWQGAIATACYVKFVLDSLRDHIKMFFYEKQFANYWFHWAFKAEAVWSQIAAPLSSLTNIFVGTKCVDCLCGVKHCGFCCITSMSCCDLPGWQEFAAKVDFNINNIRR